MIQAAANILFKHYKKHGAQFSWVNKFASKCNNKDLLEDLRILLG
jgi:hypothetical protein